MTNSPISEDVLTKVLTSGEPYVIERDGVPVAIVLPHHVYAELHDIAVVDAIRRGGGQAFARPAASRPDTQTEDSPR